MDNFERGRRGGRDEQGQRHSPYDEDMGRGREASRGDDDRHGRGERDERRYGQGRADSPSFSPDWSRENSEPRYSDEPYYSRNRGRSGSDDYSRGASGGWRDDDRSRWDQRARESIPREQRELAERSQSGDYYNPDWPYERGNQNRDLQRSREDDGQSHYRGYYRSAAAPFSYPGGSGMLYSESWTLHGPYSGRGPKGYKRSDQQVIEEACQRLERDGQIDASEIEVTAQDGVITLRGTVQDRATKRRAEECVESIYGARDVMNELRVAQQQGGEESQRSIGSQASQGSQRSQSALGAQSSQSSQSSQSAAGGAQRPGGGSAGGAERQSQDKGTPTH